MSAFNPEQNIDACVALMRVEWNGEGFEFDTDIIVDTRKYVVSLRESFVSMRILIGLREEQNTEVYSH